jgi:SAM-dependent methyltransferase/methyltransferase-like protein
MSRPVSYDDVPYPRFAFKQTHPQHLAAIARLAGLDAPAATACRVLEIGGAAGANLIPMALALPKSQFVGVDLSEVQIASATMVAHDLGLENIRFEAADILCWAGPLGQPPRAPFDYIVAHGVYSWTPPEVRNRLLRLCGEWLAPRGVAYVSYKAYPGGHVSDMLRQMALHANRDIDDSRRWPDRLNEFLNFLGEHMPRRDSAYRAVVLEQTRHIKREDPRALVHDELEADSQPVYFHEFMDQAQRHGLQYLGDADYAAMCGAGTPPDALAQLCSSDDILEREQYLDFIYGRSLRATLLCGAGARLDRRAAAEQVIGMLAGGDIRCLGADQRPISPGAVDLVSDAPRHFLTRHGTLEVCDPVGAALLVSLAELFPRAMPTSELAAQTESRLSSAGYDISALQGPFTLRVATRLLEWSQTAAVQLDTFQPPFAVTAGSRPLASPLARYEAARGWSITSLLHHHVNLPDPALRQLLSWLDGGQDRQTLAARLARPVLSGKATIEVAGRRLIDKREIRQAFAKHLDDCLQRFCRDALLIA